MKVGVMLPTIEDHDGRDGGIMPSYQTIRELALAVDESGLDSVWVPDHLIFRFPDQKETGVWEGWTMLAALAEVTSRVELGTLVLCVPFRNPALTARMATTLDEVSGGRLILGLGASWHQPEFDAFGFPFDQLASRFEEGLQIIAPLAAPGSGCARWKVRPCRCQRPPARAAAAWPADPGGRWQAAHAAAHRAPRRCLKYLLVGRPGQARASLTYTLPALPRVVTRRRWR